MASSIEDNLGARHKYINKIVSESSKGESVYNKFDGNGSDIDNIIKIDIACKNRDIDFIIKILQSNDMLYVSRAIKHCPWLISEVEYEHLINPQYLNEYLYPKMTVKAASKLNKYIKLNLKDNKRVEMFYLAEKESKKAAEWLPHCSINFIISNFKKHVKEVDLTLLRRICERTPDALNIYVTNNNCSYSKQQALQTTIFLLKSDYQKYLDVVESQPDYIFPKFNKQSTELLMKNNTPRIIEKFQNYSMHIDVGVFLKHLKKENIKSFLFNIFTKKPDRRFMDFQIFTNFLKAMPEVDRIEIVKKVILNKINLNENDNPPVQPLGDSMRNLLNFTCTCKRYVIYDHYWYRFTPFNVAVTEIKRLMSNQNSDDEIISMFDTLFVTTSGSLKNLTSVIDFFCKNYQNTKLKIKEAVVKNIISQGNIQHLDQNLWNLIKVTFMDGMFNTTNKITYCESYMQTCIEIIIIYETLNMKNVEDQVQECFKLCTLKSYQSHLSHTERDKLFNYLYNIHMKRLNSNSSSSKEEFMNKLELLENALNLLLDWNKELNKFPAVINAIKDMLKIKDENSWDIDFTNVYNKNKLWRKDLFDEALRMDQNEPVLINTLKHDPAKLDRYLPKLHTEILNKNIPLQLYHTKIKIYWSDTRLKQLTNFYKEQVKKGICNKASIRALIILLPKNELLEMLAKYVPKEDKINVNDIDDTTINIQQYLAKNMYLSRPQPDPEIIISYSRGDYLPYALPSLYSIFLNLPLIQSQQFIPMLLDTQPSVQKHGIRFAFKKFLVKDVENLLNKILKTNKNPSIKHVAFSLTFKFLCKEKDPKNIQSLYQILETFIHNLNYEENTGIYDLLFEVKDLPSSVQPMYLVKAYTFLKGLMTSNAKYETYKNSFERLITYAKEVIENLPAEFIESIVSEFIAKELLEEKSFDKIELISSYLLNGKEERLLADKSILALLLNKCLSHWDDTNKTKSQVAKYHLINLLEILIMDTKMYLSEKKLSVPMKVLKMIQTELEKTLNPSDYFILTKWKLFVTFIENFNAQKQPEDSWDNTCSRLTPLFSEHCKNILNTDCNIYFTNVYSIFAKALKSCLDKLVSEDTAFDILYNMIHDEKSIHVYLTVILYMKHLYLYCDRDSSKNVENVKKLFELIQRHPSTEVQMHYYQCRNVHLHLMTEAIICNQIKQNA